MTMMMTSSLFGLEDMEAHLWGPSSPMADAMGSAAFHPDQEDHRKGGQTSMDGVTSPVSPFSSSFLSSSSPHPFYTPPRSPPAVLQGKTEISSDPLPFPWLAHSGQLGDPEVVVSADSKDVFGDLDWMAERVDLSDFDLDSLIGTSSPNEESPSDPDDLLASLDCPIELDSFPIPILSSLAPPSPDISHSPSVGSDPVISSAETASHDDACDVPSSPDSSTPEPQEELEMKSESKSADSPSPPSPYDDSSSSPAYTLDLGSEVDVPMDEVVATVIPPPVQRFVVSLSPTRIVLVLAPKNDASAHSTGPMRSNVNHSSPPASPQTRSSRTRPYPDPKQKYKPHLPTVKVKPFPGSDERETWKAPKNKKLKKMEQNKTAATRYRQKKRAEQDLLLTEYSLLERKNVELKEKAESMAREIEYLKELMEEVRLARLKSGH
ncbi:activating transcription factor 4b isoform X2 [Hippocampus comes]|uniref:activating transcription factor 4b isoform X2 n=1 Tax=Hippocampus comes TaxID=109280 RepID=UPI00094EBF56|nr:PREDICTED: cyclic AMP-dependent transcription factor ATF-4-like isoform X2 [Hippocampus comes]